MLAAILACAFVVFFTAESSSSLHSEAGRKYAVASERLADLKKSPLRKKYRSYWLDCIRTFELVEKQYPGSTPAGDACVDRAQTYLDLYQVSRYARDLNQSLKVFEQCQSAYPRHKRAPESLYRALDALLDHKKNRSAAEKIYKKLAASYPSSDWTSRAKSRLAPPRRKQEPEFRRMPVPVIAAPAPTAQSGTVKGIRFWSGGAYTRIVIDKSASLKYAMHELKNPDRLVFDIQNAQIDDAVDREPLPVHDGILKQVRSSQYDPTTVRIVLDLANIKSYMVFPLHEPDRLVIDVTGESGQLPVAASTATGDQSKGTPNADSQQQGSSGDQAADNQGAKLSLSRQMGLKIKTIAIDAGHGGHDPGAIGRGGLKEKEVTLDIAKRLERLVKDRLDSSVIMTRDRDEYIPLEQRPFIAKSKGADLFVSIHVNASRKRRVRGIETYIQSLRASDRDAMATAALENATSSKTLSQLGSELDRILKDLRTDDKQEESLQLAHFVQNSMVDTMRPVKGHVVNLGVKRAFFYVLINTEMPSILAEVGFISNPDDEKLLRKDSYRQQIAEALFEGIKKYVDARTPRIAGM